ncbi:MAG: SBBP repeat-containing protein [Bacteroidia bacterium]|nr:SBBP repeat-containing protein [Bacteroidia bacterium]
MSGLDAWITKYGVNYTFYKIEQPAATDLVRSAHKDEFDCNAKNEILVGHRVLFELQNHNPNPIREGKKQQEGYYNYFIGNDESKHATYVGLYKEALIKDVYQGIDIRYYFDNGKLRYDFIVQPYADVSQIKFKLHGQYNAYTKSHQELCFTTRFGEVSLTDLHTYQDNHIINSKFIKDGDFWQIAIGQYDKSKLMVIDPLVYSTYIGGGSNEECYDIFVDNTGCAFVTGRTQSTDYDTTPGAFQTTHGTGTWDAFVTKINATGSSLLYSTYIGGNDFDAGHGIFVDSNGHIYITGQSSSNNYYTTSGAFQTAYGGGFSNVIVTKFNATGSSIVYSTYIGGTNNEDIGRKIFVDNSGCAYITGNTSSLDYDTTPGALQTTYAGGWYDGFITKLNASGSGLLYSTYIGGTGDDYGRDIFVDNTGCAYVTGSTNSTDYDITSGAFQTTHGGGLWDAFVSKFSATGGLLYSTYIGGGAFDLAFGIFVDGSNNAYIIGRTQSTDYHTTSGAFQSTNSGGNDVFVTKLNSSGNGLVYSTYIGGASNDFGRDIFVDNTGCAYITGQTQSTDYDVTSGAFQTTNAGNWDAFVTKLDVTGSSLLYSTYIGGSDSDEPYAIFVEGTNTAYIAGMTKSTNYDITSGTFQTTNAGGYDAFVTKINLTVTQIQESAISIQSYFSLYPNPAQSYIVIENHTSTIQEYEIADVSGKVLKVQTLPQGKNTVELNLPAGVYIIRDRKQGKTEKFVVE